MPHPLRSDSTPEPSLNSLTGRVLDDEVLLRQVFAHDARQGYTLLFRQYYRPLCSHAVRYLYSREAAEDLVSDVFLHFWRTQAHEQVTTSFGAYLFRAVRNRALNALRDGAKQPITELAPPQNDTLVTVDDPELILRGTELFQQIQQTVSELPPQCQRVFILSRFEGKPGAEIARELQLSPKTVEMHLTKALNILRRLLSIQP